MTIRWGIIGFGRFGRIHADVLAGMDGAEVIGICSRREVEPSLLPAGVVSVDRDVEHFVNRQDLDVILVATHWRDHFAAASSALNAGKHLFLEKPMAATREECEQLLAIAERARGISMVGHICRFDARVWMAREAILAGQIGRIVYMRSRRNLPVAPGSVRLDKVSPLIGDGVHDADLMMWFMGRGPSRVYGTTVKTHRFTFDDIGCAWLHFDSAAVGYVETVWCLPETSPTVIDAHLEVIGTEGKLAIDCSVTGLEITTSKGVKRSDTDYWPLIDGYRQGALRDELGYFVDCIRRGVCPRRVTLREAARAVAVMLRAEESAKENRPLDFEDLA
ncbi:MAG: Gfo/Idh/MocA family oxidoreductase [Pirellulaceae bacterium]